MILSKIRTLKKRFLVVQNEENGKWNVFDLKNKSFLFDWCDFIESNKVSDYLIVEQNKKSAIYHLEKGFVTQWFDYDISLQNYLGNIYVRLLSKLFDKEYFIASKPYDGKQSKKAFFKFDGTQVSDWFYNVRLVKVDDEDILYIAQFEDYSESLFSLKKGKVMDIIGTFYYEEEFKKFALGKKDFYSSKKDDSYVIINKNNEIVIRAKYIECILKEKYNKNDDSIYIVINEKGKKAIFYNGYLTEYYDVILPISPNLIFLAYHSKRKHREIYLLDLKNKINTHISVPLFNHIKNMVICINTEKIKSYFRGFGNVCLGIEKYSFTFRTNTKSYCLNCNNTWWFYIKYGNSYFCPLCDINKLHAFII
jgi:hypothetical protein